MVALDLRKVLLLNMMFFNMIILVAFSALSAYLIALNQNDHLEFEKH